MEHSNRKRRFRRRLRPVVRLIIRLAIVGGIFYAVLQKTPGSRVLRRWTSNAMEPVIWLSTIPQKLEHIGSDIQSHKQLLRENASLRRKNLMLSARLLRYRALEEENQRLRRLLSAASTIHHRVLVATIIKASQAPYSYQILINKGAHDGIYPGQAVIDAHGVLGQVVRVNPENSIALLITDPHNGIPVQVNRTGLQTVALGRGDGQTLTLPFLPRNADIKVGDLLMSSGMGGRFPEGYPVGRVVKIKHPRGDHFMDAIAEPLAHLNRSRQVLLVWNATNRANRSETQLPINLHGQHPQNRPNRQSPDNSRTTSKRSSLASSPKNVPAHR